MTRQEHLLTILAEECVEVAQRASKCLRFGATEIQPGQDEDNAIRLIHEWWDLLALIGMCKEDGILPERPPGFPEWIQAKREKVEKFLAYSREQGTLQ
jgi:hypothetical protein